MTLANIPMLASPIDPINLSALARSDGHVMEQKLDGHRILLRVQTGLTPLALTRGGQPYSKGLPADLTSGLPNGRWVLDGEYLDGTLWVFDMLDANGLITEASTLTERRTVLEAFMALVTTPRIRLVPQAVTTDEKQALIANCRKAGAEGVMVKVKKGRYIPGGRSNEVWKAKFVETADVIVKAVRDDGKDSVLLAAWDPTKGVLVEVGRSSLIGKEKAGAIKVGDVLEVRYLYMGANKRLFQPTILKKRTDKRQDECLTDQFKHVSKTVLATL